jgi:hypothetical protein
VLVTYFVHEAARDSRAASRLKSAHSKAIAQFPERRGLPRRRLSMKLPSRIHAEVRTLAESTGLNTTELVKSLIAEIQSEVLERQRPQLMQKLRALSAISV